MACTCKPFTKRNKVSAGSRKYFQYFAENTRRQELHFVRTFSEILPPFVSMLNCGWFVFRKEKYKFCLPSNLFSQFFSFNIQSHLRMNNYQHRALHRQCEMHYVNCLILRLMEDLNTHWQSATLPNAHESQFDLFSLWHIAVELLQSNSLAKKRTNEELSVKRSTFFQLCSALCRVNFESIYRTKLDQYVFFQFYF